MQDQIAGKIHLSLVEIKVYLKEISESLKVIAKKAEANN
jgi:hypothetical protein